MPDTAPARSVTEKLFVVDQVDLFNEEYYLAVNPDCAAANISGLDHFIRFGAVEGRNPHPLFDVIHYSRQMRRLGHLEVNPLVHYISYGATHGLSPHLLFDSEYYLSGQGGSCRAGTNPLVHFLKHGRQGNPHPLFDTNFYLGRNPDVARSTLNPLVHFVLFGGSEGRASHPLFDSAFYLQEYRDVAASGENPLIHYLRIGEAEGRLPNPLFDPIYAHAQVDSLPLFKNNLLIHYAVVGGFRGMKPHPLFDSEYYLSENKDVAHAGLCPLYHYMSSGGVEGRKPHPWFDPVFYLDTDYGRAAQGVNPLVHYIRQTGAVKGDPHPAFDSRFYIASMPRDVRGKVNPLMHFVTEGIYSGYPPCAEISRNFLFRSLRHADGDLGNMAAIISAHRDRCIALLSPPQEDRNYQAWLERRIIERKAEYELPSEALDIHLTFITTIYDTPIKYIQALVESVLNQEEPGNFNWFILDNGSKHPDVVAYLETLKYLPDITLHRTEKNLGIVGGMRYCLENCQGDYVLPLDSDDLLTRDCLRVIRSVLHRNQYPDLLYTDEDKVEDESRFLPYFKPDFDPILFINSCFIAHLTAIRRTRALELECYTDREVEGSHDWDSFTRFLIGGSQPVHVPDVTYSWRVHQGSTSGNIGSKAYITSSQQTVLDRFLAGLPEGHRFGVDQSPFFDSTPDWWICGHRLNPRPIITLNITSGPSTDAFATLKDRSHTVVNVPIDQAFRTVRQIAEANSNEDVIVHILGDAKPLKQEWPIEAESILQLFTDTVMVGGPVFFKDRLSDGGRYFGFGRGCDCPDVGRFPTDPGYFAQMWKQHSVSAVCSQNLITTAAFLADALRNLADYPVSIHYLGTWLGAQARRREKRVAFSPFLGVESNNLWDEEVDDVERAMFVLTNHNLLPEQALYSPRLALSRSAAYQPASNEERIHHVDQLFRWARDIVTGATARIRCDDILAERMASRSQTHLLPAVLPTFSVLTTIYEMTDAALFAGTADAVLAQTVRPLEWIVLAHGPIDSACANIVTDLSNRGLLNLFALPKNLGIIGGLRYCLERAKGDYIIPLDADDLITPDALRLFAAAASDGYPDLLYSDEDFLVQGRKCNPVLRPHFDPALNLNSSHIWHLCAIRRETALAAGLYTDSNVNYCHDWDTVTRFWQAGKIIKLVPEILYHWRQHESSTSNSGTGVNGGSLTSVSRLLARTAENIGVGDRFEVRDYPLFRGGRELYLERRAIAPWLVDVVLMGVNDQPRLLSAEMLRNLTGYPFSMIMEFEAPEEHAPVADFVRLLANANAPLVVLVDARAVPIGDRWPWDAIGHFESLPDTVAVTGRILSDLDTVVVGGEIIEKSGQISAPYFGRHARDPGPMALALKPQSINIVNLAFSMLSTGWLQQVLTTFPPETRLSELPSRLGVGALSDGKRIIYSPILQARLNAVTAPNFGWGVGWTTAELRLPGQQNRMGAAAYAEYERHVIARYLT